MRLAQLPELDRAHAEQLLGLMARGQLDLSLADDQGRTTLHEVSEA